MAKRSHPSIRSGANPTPEIEPSPGSVPRKFPENPTPLSDDGLEAAKKNTTPTNRVSASDNPPAESDLPADNPERPQKTDQESDRH